MKLVQMKEDSFFWVLLLLSGSCGILNLFLDVWQTHRWGREKETWRNCKKLERRGLAEGSRRGTVERPEKGGRGAPKSFARAADWGWAKAARRGAKNRRATEARQRYLVQTCWIFCSQWEKMLKEIRENLEIQETTKKTPHFLHFLWRCCNATMLQANEPTRCHGTCPVCQGYGGYERRLSPSDLIGLGAATPRRGHRRNRSRESRVRRVPDCKRGTGHVSNVTFKPRLPTHRDTRHTWHTWCNPQPKLSPTEHGVQHLQHEWKNGRFWEAPGASGALICTPLIWTISWHIDLYYLESRSNDQLRTQDAALAQSDRANSRPCSCVYMFPCGCRPG